MVAKITTPHRLLDALNYNEQKVVHGKAQCITMAGYLGRTETLNFYLKLQVLENRNALNERATTQTLHVSLNFDPSEKLSQEKLSAIADSYMQKLGFGDQPYLVYQHFDAGHPHVHIVSTLIREDGSRINTNNLGRIVSEKARKEIEREFQLIKAEHQRQQKNSIQVIPTSKVVYGKTPTKNAIASIVSQVVNKYRYTSLPELNAALSQFGVVADRCKEGGRIYRHKGLVYRLMNEKGEKAGVPIKASSLPGKPTLNFLEKQFLLHEVKRAAFKEKLIRTLDDVLKTNPASVTRLVNSLKGQGVYTLPRMSAEGKIYGITFVDNNTGCVFNGSDLGKSYSAAALQTRLETIEALNPSKDLSKFSWNGDSKSINQSIKTTAIKSEDNTNMKSEAKMHSLLDILLSRPNINEPPPPSLLPKKRKRKGKYLGH